MAKRTKEGSDDNNNKVDRSQMERDIVAFLKADKNLDVNVGFLADSGANIKRWFDTGSLTWNFLSSGNLSRGLPYGRVVEVHGRTTTGKSLLGAQVAAMAQMNGAITFFFDPEYGMDEKFIRSVGGDPDRIISITKLGTIEAFNRAMTRMIEYLADKNKDAQIPVVMVLDSLAMLSSDQELKSPDKNDMTKAKKIRQFFRTYMDACVRHGILLFVVNQVYENIGVMFGPPTTPTGGAGLPYAASQRYSLLSPRYEKEGDKSQGDMTGTSVKVKTLKNRVSVPFRSVFIRFTYEFGIDRYGGLFELMTDGDKGNVTSLNVLQREGNRWVWPGVIDEKFYERDFVEIFKADEARYIEELQKVIDDKAKKKEIAVEQLTEEEKSLIESETSEERLLSAMNGVES